VIRLWLTSGPWRLATRSRSRRSRPSALCGADMPTREWCEQPLLAIRRHMTPRDQLWILGAGHTPAILAGSRSAAHSHRFRPAPDRTAAPAGSGGRTKPRNFVLCNVVATVGAISPPGHRFVRRAPESPRRPWRQALARTDRAGPGSRLDPGRRLRWERGPRTTCRSGELPMWPCPDLRAGRCRHGARIWARIRSSTVPRVGPDSGECFVARAIAWSNALARSQRASVCPRWWRDCSATLAGLVLSKRGLRLSELGVLVS
jgi:hypothetical protein